MYYTIEHELPRRLRIRLNGTVRTTDVDALSRVLTGHPAISAATIYPRIGSVALVLDDAGASREDVLGFLDEIDSSALDAVRPDCPQAFSMRTHGLALDFATLIGGYALRRLLPAPLALAYAIWQYRRFLYHALRSLLAGRLEVPTLDAAAIAAAFVQGDVKTASETMFLLDAGELMESYTHARSENELIYSLLSITE